MKNTITENSNIQELLGRYLASRNSLKSSAAETSLHLDDDSLTVFVEGALSPRESTPVLHHLVECSFCLHKTAELVRLDLAFAADSGDLRQTSTTEPSSVSAVLQRLLSNIFGTTDGAVFAHQEDKDDEPKAVDDTKDKEK
jgi:hypothetical protein